jgi:3-phytase
MKWVVCLASLLIASCSSAPTVDFLPRTPPVLQLTSYVATAPVPDDPDDPAIWIHPQDPARSVIVATNKVEKPGGSVVVFDLDGKILQSIGNLNRPNNVDIEQRVRVGTEVVDIAVITERDARAIRIYAIDPHARTLSQKAVFRAFEKEQGDRALPMGVGIYRRSDGAAFVILGRKSGPAKEYLWQYRLDSWSSLKLVRKFGAFGGVGEIEAIVVDDALGYVYYADERMGVRKYHADPDAADAQSELALFGQDGYSGDREGLAIYAPDDRTGYLISTDQIEGKSRYLLYRREGGPAGPHDHKQPAAVFESSADSTDGIDAASVSFGPELSRGILVVMNSGPRNFLIFPWPEL